MTKHTRPLTADLEIPLLGFGTYLIPDGDAATLVREAIHLGYRHIDTAEFYRNEVGVGAGIKEALVAEKLERKDVFVTTKLFPGNPAWGQTPKTYETTLSTLDESLQKLGLDFVDLYLIHAPLPNRVEQWRALVELKKRGKARAIGVFNFNIAHLEELKAAGLPAPDANQLELHPWSQKPALVAYLAEHHITPIAYSSLVPLPTWRTAEGHASGKTAAMKAEGERADAPFKTLAAKYGVSEAQVLLRWAIQKGYPVLPKSTKPERMKQNADVFSFTIDDGDMASIAKMDRGAGLAWGESDPVDFA